MSWHVAALNLDNLDDLPKRCRRCVFWELSETLGKQAADFGSTELEKEAWISEVLLEWGSCGRIVHIGGVPAGYVMYAPAVRGAALDGDAHRSGQRGRGAAHHDAGDARVLRGGTGPDARPGRGADLTRRGVKAIEVFGDQRPGTEPGCLVPADFLRGVGFKTIRPHPRWPRLRMELRSAMTWKEDVEAALEQLLGTITIPMQAAAPVGRSTQPGLIGSERPPQRALSAAAAAFAASRPIRWLAPRRAPAHGPARRRT